MPANQRIGHHLRDIASLSDHDVEEILCEQEHSRQPFGQIALAWGMCKATDVWRAWVRQLDGSLRPVDLERVGIDAAAAALIGRETAFNLQAIPVRVVDEVVIAAVCERTPASAAEELRRLLQRETRLVLCGSAQLAAALAQYYPRRAAG